MACFWRLTNLQDLMQVHYQMIKTLGFPSESVRTDSPSNGTTAVSCQFKSIAKMLFARFAPVVF